MPNSTLQYRFRPALSADISQIMEILEQAKAQMHREGKDQWNASYPTLRHVENDLVRRYGFVFATETGIAAYGALVYDGEPAYDRLDGSWLSEQPYLVVHRLAVGHLFRRRGIGAAFMQEAENHARAKGLHSFRVDTNRDNFHMQRIIEKLGFSYCGKIRYPQGEPLAYEKRI